MEDRLTLQKGLDKFHKKNMKFFSNKTLSEEGTEFLSCHDVAHVVFGCDTSFYGEGLVTIWTTFGTTLSFWKVIKGNLEAGAFAMMRKYSFLHVIKNIIRFLWVIPIALIRVNKMTKAWPFLDYKVYLDIPIVEIRKEFGIQPIS